MVSRRGQEPGCWEGALVFERGAGGRYGHRTGGAPRTAPGPFRESQPSSGGGTGHLR